MSSSGFFVHMNKLCTHSYMCIDTYTHTCVQHTHTYTHMYTNIHIYILGGLVELNIVTKILTVWVLKVYNSFSLLYSSLKGCPSTKKSLQTKTEREPGKSSHDTIAWFMEATGCQLFRRPRLRRSRKLEATEVDLCKEMDWKVYPSLWCLQNNTVVLSTALIAF